MIKRIRSEIIKIWDWLVIDFEKLMLSASKGRLSLQTQPINGDVPHIVLLLIEKKVVLFISSWQELEPRKQ